MKLNKLNFHKILASPVSGGDLISPRLVVLPMGWSWSLHLAQSISVEALLRSGVPEQNLIVDKRPCPSLASHVCAAAYVDNFMCVGSSREAVRSTGRKIHDTLNASKLPTHDVVDAEPRCEFVGLEFCNNSVSIKRQRFWRIRFAIDELLLRNKCSSSLMQVIVGHISWMILIRRCALCLLDSCYAFAAAGLPSQSVLWSSAAKQLWWIRSLLPLFIFNLESQWHPVITCTDASEVGLGCCYTRCDQAKAREFGKVSERWRFQFEDAVQARNHALGAHQSQYTPAVNKDALQYTDSDGILVSEVNPFTLK